MSREAPVQFCEGLGVKLLRSTHLKDRYDIFGGLPDCIEDDWIENIEGFVRLADTHLHMRKQVSNIFETTWGSTINGEDDRWEECARVLSQKDINSIMSKPWGKRGGLKIGYGVASDKARFC